MTTDYDADAVERAARLLAVTARRERYVGRALLLEVARGRIIPRMPPYAERARFRDDALRALEMTAREREIAALRDELHPRVIRALDLIAVRRRDELRLERAAARTIADPILTRRPGDFVRLAALKALHAALETAKLRRARHVHTATVDYVDRGREGARSEASSEWASEAGMSAAYQRAAYRVTSSRHEWRVSSAILAVPAALRAAPGVVYLSPTCRVRQGRGTSLVCERRGGKRWTR